MKEKAFLMDIDLFKENIRLILKSEKGRVFRLFDRQFKPYFYFKGEIESLKERGVFEKTEKLLGFDKIELWKVSFKSPQELKKERSFFESKGTVFEGDIQFVYRYLIDKKLIPMGMVEVDYEEDEVKEIKAVEGGGVFNPNVLCFDIETYNERGMSNPSKDPCLMISYVGRVKGKEIEGVLTYKNFKKDFVTVFENEKQMIEGFAELLKKNKIDVIAGYNSDLFDLPYLAERSRILGVKTPFGRDKSRIKLSKGIKKTAKITGRVHVDVFKVISFLNAIGSVKLHRLTLENASTELVGFKKKMVVKKNIYELWNETDYILVEYCLDDSKACLELLDFITPLEVELSKLSGIPLFNASRNAASNFVESILMRESFEKNTIIPSLPKDESFKERYSNPIQGAFVKIPNPGIYENIAVLDFKSLYPSIIISYNIDPSTLNLDCNEFFISPQGHKFCKTKKGLIPIVLENLVNARNEVKKEMKKFEPESFEYKSLFARQWALKIIANAVYGYMVYPRSRFYSRECGESITAIARKSILEAMNLAEKNGFIVLYIDTDSLFLKFNLGEESKVEEFRKLVNKTLPEKMELELEDFYNRGIFVSKKQGTAGAKKKYALINRKGVIKIRGFELVRRDWSRIARETQRKVLEALLKKGDLEEAVAEVKRVISLLKEEKADLQDLEIHSTITKSLKSYEIMSPEVSAAKKAEKRGLKVEVGSSVGFVITKNGKSISDKAEFLEFAKDYDADYYVNNQVLPAVLKILGELGVQKEDLLNDSRQKNFGDWN
jgi:DNA polymerase I